MSAATILSWPRLRRLNLGNVPIIMGPWLEVVLGKLQNSEMRWNDPYVICAEFRDIGGLQDSCVYVEESRTSARWKLRSSNEDLGVTRFLSIRALT